MAQSFMASGRTEATPTCNELYQRGEDGYPYDQREQRVLHIIAGHLVWLQLVYQQQDVTSYWSTHIVIFIMA